MLQPNQPMGTPNMAATGPQGAKPQQPQQQTAPAGALMGMMPGGGIMAPIDKVANAYASNPQALDQKGLNGDLLAALAAQRLKSKMEAAKRELEMAAGGQQGQPQKTVVEQNEDALLEMTKNEMQQEQAETLQQKQNQMQEGQKRLMQQAMNQQAGLPGLPAPNVAQPKAMAAGGIVAFADGGDTGGYDIGGGEYTPSSGSGLMGALPQLRSQSPEEQARINELLEKYRGRIDYKKARAVAEGRMSEDEILRPVATAQPGAQVGTSVAAGAQTKLVPDGTQRRTNENPRITDTRPAPEAQGLANIPGRNAELNRAMISALKTNPSEATAAERQSAYEFMKPSDEDMAARREGLASLKALNAAENAPDRQWVRRALRTLPSSGTSFMANTLGQVGANALAARDEEYARQLQGLSNEEKMLKGIMSDIYTPKKEAVGAGTAAGQQASGVLSHAISSAAQTYIGELQAAAQREVAAANREGINAQKAMALLSTVTNNREKARGKLVEELMFTNPDYQLLSKDPSKLSSSEQKRANEARIKFAQTEAEALGGFDRMISNLESQLYGKGVSSGTTGNAVPFSSLPK